MANNTVKKKKFYKVNEIVWSKIDKTKATVVSLDTKTYDAVIRVGDKEKTVKFWDITKLRKFNRRFAKPLGIKVKYLTTVDDVFKPLEKTDKGDWIDLRAAETVELKAGEHKLIPLGVAMKLPYGYEAWIAPRSSTFKHWGILQTNSVGIVDNSYSSNSDEWKMSVYATRDTVINRGDRICQFRIVRSMPRTNIVTVDDLGNNARGGFGSTGTN